MNNLFRRSAAPAVACLLHQTFSKQISSTKQHQYDSVVHCEDDVHVQKIKTVAKVEELKIQTLEITERATSSQVVAGEEKEKKKEEEEGKESKNSNGENVDEEEESLFHNLFPLRQLWRPKVEYPLWDEDWDGRKMECTGEEKKDREMKRYVRKNGVTRHIILIRHGQYDESSKEDEKRILTPLGRKQAELTGQRLAKMIEGFDKKFGPCNVKTIRVSNMTRAKETADIIAQSLPESVIRAKPDENLNEGRPCHHIPGGRVSERAVRQTDECHDRIETAFNTYLYRADPPSMEEHDNPKEKEEVLGNIVEKKDDNGDEDTTLKPHPQHEFEIIVCHANVVRYFLCRALQIPPEAWLRLCTFNCSLTYLTVRSTGTVSCRMLGDIGHLGYEHSTFSMHHGFNW